MAGERSGQGETRPRVLMDFTNIKLFSIDQKITARINIVTPGYLENYDRKRLEVNCICMNLYVLHFISLSDRQG